MLRPYSLCGSQLVLYFEKTFIVQLAQTDERMVTLPKVDHHSTGTYKCEVSVSSLLFKTYIHSTQLRVVGKYHVFNMLISTLVSISLDITFVHLHSIPVLQETLRFCQFLYAFFISFLLNLSTSFSSSLSLPILVYSSTSKTYLFLLQFNKYFTLELLEKLL